MLGVSGGGYVEMASSQLGFFFSMMGDEWEGLGWRGRAEAGFCDDNEAAGVTWATVGRATMSTLLLNGSSNNGLLHNLWNAVC